MNPYFVVVNNGYPKPATMKIVDFETFKKLTATDSGTVGSRGRLTTKTLKGFQAHSFNIEVSKSMIDDPDWNRLWKQYRANMSSTSKSREVAHSEKLKADASAKAKPKPAKKPAAKLDYGYSPASYLNVEF